MADSNKNDPSRFKKDSRKRPRENYPSGPKERDSPTGVLLRSDGSNLARWREALSNYLTAEYPQQGSIVKNNAYPPDPNYALPPERWAEIAVQHDLVAAEIRKMKADNASKEIAELRAIELQRRAMYGVIRESIHHNVLQELAQVPGYAAIHAAGNQPLEFVRLVLEHTYGHTSTLRPNDRLDQVFRNWYSLYQRDTQTDLDYFQECARRHDALVNAAHPECPALPAAVRNKIKSLNSRRHLEYVNTCINNDTWPVTWEEAITELGRFVPTKPISRPREHLTFGARIQGDYAPCPYCKKTNHLPENCRWKPKDGRPLGGSASSKYFASTYSGKTQSNVRPRSDSSSTNKTSGSKHSAGPKESNDPPVASPAVESPADILSA